MIEDIVCSLRTLGLWSLLVCGVSYPISLKITFNFNISSQTNLLKQFINVHLLTEPSGGKYNEASLWIKFLIQITQATRLTVPTLVQLNKL